MDILKEILQRVNNIEKLLKEQQEITNNTGYLNNHDNVSSLSVAILEKKIEQYSERYPTALKPYHIEEILGVSLQQVYRFLNNGSIPAAKKIPGMGWRIPRDVFLTWWFSEELDSKEG